MAPGTRAERCSASRWEPPNESPELQDLMETRWMRPGLRRENLEVSPHISITPSGHDGVKNYGNE